MSKKTDWRIWVLIVAAIALVGYFSGLFSTLVPQEREIGRLMGLGAGDYTCPATYNGLQVDRCNGFRYRVGFELWRYSLFQGYTFSRTECQTLKTQGYQDSNTCREVIAGAGQPGQYGTLPDSTFPLGFSPGETASFSTGSGDITYFESFIQCPGGGYDYRSLCPKPTICPDGSTVYAPNICKIEPPKPPVPIWESIWNQIADFLTSLFKDVRFFSIVGSQTVSPGMVNSYVISLPAPTAIDLNYADGTYSFRYSNWALTDKTGTIKQQGTWESVNNSYEKTVSITSPANPGDYAIIATIVEYKYNFDVAQNKWIIDGGIVIAKEGINVASKIMIVPPPPLNLPDFGKIISDALNGFFSWLGSLFK